MAKTDWKQIARLDVVRVYDGSVLACGRTYGAAPAANVVFTLTPPPAIITADCLGWFGVINAGAGSVDVTGLGTVPAGASVVWTSRTSGWFISTSTTAATVGTASDIAARTTTARLWSGADISDAINTNDDDLFRSYVAGSTLDFDAVLTAGANGRPLRTFAFGSGVNLVNPPDGSASFGVSGCGGYQGDATNGLQHVTFYADSLDRTTHFWRLKSGAVLDPWQSSSSDSWTPSRDTMQISSGMRIALADGHTVRLLASERNRAIRMIPVNTWASCITPVPSAGWTFATPWPVDGTREVVALPHPTLDQWGISA